LAVNQRQQDATWNFIQSLYGQYELYALQPYQDEAYLLMEKWLTNFQKNLERCGAQKK